MWSWAEYGGNLPVGVLLSLNFNYVLVNDEGTANFSERSMFMIDTFWNILEHMRGYDAWKNRVIQVTRTSEVTIPVFFQNLLKFGEFDRTVMGGFNFSFPEFENEHVWIPGTSSSCLHQLWEWIVKNHSADMLPFQDHQRRAILSSNVNYTLCNQDGGCHQVHLTNQPTDTCPLRHEKGTKIPEHKDVKVQKNCGVKMTELADLLKHFDFYNPTTRKCTYLSSKKNKQGEQSIYVLPKTKRKFAVIPRPFVLFLFNGKLKPGGKIEWNVVGNSS